MNELITTTRRRRLAAALLMLAGVTVAACSTDDSGARSATTSDDTPTPSSDLEASLSEPPLGVQRVPDVAFETLAGDPVRLSDLEGQVVILNFWGTWCAPCRREIPELAELQSAYGERGAVVVGVAIDSGDEESILAFADEYGVNYPIWISSGEVATGRFGVIGYPFTLIIDRDGLIRNQFIGPQTYETLEAEIVRLSDESTD